MSTLISPQNMMINLGRKHAPATTPVLNYHTTTSLDDSSILKTLAGFVGGGLVMGVMLSFVAAVARVFLHKVALAGVEQDFARRCALLAGSSFVGASLLLVALKAREERSALPLHARHWLVSLGTGAAYALAVFGPNLAAEQVLSMNRFAWAALSLIVLVFPVVATYWMMTRETPDRPAEQA